MRDYRSIRGRDVDGAHASPDFVRVEAALRRRDRAKAGKCMNNEAHGPATHGKKCRRCYAVHRYGAELVEQRGVDNLDLSPRRARSASHCISHLGAA